MVNTLRRLAVTVSALTCVIVLLAGCSLRGGGDEPPTPTPSEPTVPPNAVATSTAVSSGDLQAPHLEPGEPMTRDEFIVLVKLRKAEYSWPEEYEPDIDAQYSNEGKDLPAEVFDQGSEYAALNGFHSCAWLLTWVDARKSHNTHRESEALVVMSDVLPYDPGIESSPSSYTWMVDMAQAAALGDPTKVNQYINANCGDAKWKRTTAGPPSGVLGPIERLAMVNRGDRATFAWVLARGR